MSDLKSRLAALSPEQLAKLNAKLKSASQQIITKRPAGSSVAMSDNQRRMWFLQHLAGAGGVYNMLGAIELEGALNIPALNSSVNRLISCHEILRTAFAQQGDELLQIIADKHQVDIEVQPLNIAPIRISASLATALAGFFRLSF